MSRSIRIGNAQAFWGDRSAAAAEMLNLEPELDYLTLDYLAEVSMSILAMQRQLNPELGYARDFVDVIRSLAPYWAAGGSCRVLANAGGLNPAACADACRKALEQAGCPSLRIGIVRGDDVVDELRSAAAAEEFKKLDDGESLAGNVDRIVTANAYLGARPIADALAVGAQIVITGRVADPSLVVAACLHHFGWQESELDRLAGATVAGHLIECGTQVTGGISTDWLNVPDPANIGFPIVEVDDSGNCIVCKPHGTGGRVTTATVREQLVYEIGDPRDYRSPDVCVSFDSLCVEDLGSNRVRVSGAVGHPSPERYKVSATLRDGYRSAGTLVIVGRDAVHKAKRCGEMVLERVCEAGFQIRDSVIECLGSGACAGNVLCQDSDGDPDVFGEVVLRIAIESETQAVAERFARELMPLITAGPQGTTGYAEGRPRVRPVIRYWPCLIDRDRVTPCVDTIQTDDTSTAVGSPSASETQANTMLVQGGIASQYCEGESKPDFTADKDSPKTHAPRLGSIAFARSGDKGTSANIGVLSQTDRDWDFLQAWLTADRVAAFLQPLGVQSVERYELKNLGALNFVIRGILQNRLRSDAQGKTLGQLLLEMPLPTDCGRTIETEQR
ncbi:acyclic terpene utilization AtuA family protein [Rosistilla oblonga]|uniref:acyclic terpene utilization AtuA family protein n=1 Tax=Rosistilla oblonga TaxID=2527990 RepID=UPI003A976E0E